MTDHDTKRRAALDVDTLLAAGVVAAGAATLLLRRQLLGSPDARPLFLLSFLCLGFVSCLVPMARGARRLPGPGVLAIGVGAFVLATLMVGHAVPLPHGPEALALNSVAAVSEEAFFRRLVYGALSRFGPTSAIMGSALLFAAIHVPLYGGAVFWIDLGASLVFSWQRWASGTWTHAAGTHVIANALAVLR